MNTSDQNVFPLDTAFKRRWGREKITNNWAEVGEIKNMYVPYTDVTWETFATIINKEMVSISARNDAPISEDKQMGAYFANETMLTKEPNSKDEEKIDNFANNVLDYLFTDVTKFDHKVLFEEHIYTSDDVYNRVEAYKNNLIGKTDGVDSDNTTSQSIFTEIFSKDISSELIENAKVVDEDNG